MTLSHLHNSSNTLVLILIYLLGVWVCSAKISGAFTWTTPVTEGLPAEPMCSLCRLLSVYIPIWHLETWRIVINSNSGPTIVFEFSLWNSPQNVCTFILSKHQLTLAIGRKQLVGLGVRRGQYQLGLSVKRTTDTPQRQLGASETAERQKLGSWPILYSSFVSSKLKGIFS